MTNRERLCALIGFEPGRNVAEAALIDNRVSVNADYVIENLSIVKLSAIQVIKTLLSTADTGNSLTGFQIKYDRPSLLQLIKTYENDLEITTSYPTIRGVHVW